MLEAHLSSRRIGAPLRRGGHDVRTLAAEPALEALADPDVLSLAAEEGRILVTRNSRDFAPILRVWAESGRQHAGCILIWSYQQGEFAAIVTAIERALASRPGQERWQGMSAAI